jgi:hypothetical protein
MTKDAGEICQHCGALVVTYKHCLSPLLMVALLKFKRAGGRGILSEIKSLTTVERLNFQKLKYWGLVFNVKDTCEWQLTEKGENYLANKSRISKKVLTFRGGRVGYEGDKVTISQVMEMDADWWWREDYVAAALKNVPPKKGKQK